MPYVQTSALPCITFAGMRRNTKSQTLIPDTPVPNSHLTRLKPYLVRSTLLLHDGHTYTAKEKPADAIHIYCPATGYWAWHGAEL